MSGSTRELFGTDGIRAPFGDYPLDRPTVVALGRHLAESLRRSTGEATPEVVVGGDTRESTPALGAWLAAGLAEGGADARWVGVVPTAGVAHLVRSLGAAAGAVISASHNPYPDNGIKLLDAWGFKWSEAAEAALESRLLADRAGDREVGDRPPRAEGGLVERYLDAIASTLPGRRPLAGLAVVLDTGNGAASPYAGDLFRRLGAAVRVLHAQPDGRNVNAGCGSTDTGDLAAAVAEQGAQLGIAFDGDADRAILVDETGAERDGDAILYLWARDLARTGGLDPAAIVATSMSNLGLERALSEEEVTVVRCGVGDRQVVETMRERGIVLGGEQSGHVVHLGLTTTGDGLLTALHVAGIVARAEQPLSELLRSFVRYPQVLVNVPVSDKPAFDELPEVVAAARRVEDELGDDGRLVLRYSGTEPLARVMIEGPNQAEIEALAEEIAEAIRGSIGAAS